MALRYIGDVLISTPVALSIKERYPHAKVDYLVFKGTEGVLAKNPYVDEVYTLTPGEKGFGTFASLWRRYDVAIGCNPSDRTVMFTAAAGRRSIGFSYFSRKEWWKSLVLTECRLCDDRVHIVPLILRQLGTLGIEPRRRVVMGFDETDRRAVRLLTAERPFVVLHPYTRRSCKEWPAPNWVELARLLTTRGIRPMMTRSPSAADQAVTDDLVRQGLSTEVLLPATLPLPQLAALISQADAYVGVDTVVTHLAASLDVPTIALYGPTLSRHWGPWPNDWPDDTPYNPSGGIQRRGNVTLIQQDWPCVPCNRETCMISECGQMECLARMTAGEVFAELSKVIRV